MNIVERIQRLESLATNLTRRTSSNTRRITQQSLTAYTDTATWTGTAPSGTTSHTYGWQKIGTRCRLWVNLGYTVAGANNTNVMIPFPADAPALIAPTGFGANNEKVGIGWGWIDTALTGAAPTTRVQISKNSSGNLFISATVASLTARVVMVEVEYDCAA